MSSTGLYVRRRFTAPVGGVVKGTAYLIGSLLVVARANADAAAQFTAALGGRWTLTKTSAQAWTEGQKIYWNVSTSKLDSDGTTGPLVGVAAAVAANPSSTGDVILSGVAASTSEGPQTTIAALTDSSGGGTANGTIEAITAPTALTGAGSGTANGSLVAEGTVSTGGGNTYADSAVNTVFGKLEDNIAELAAQQEIARVAIVALMAAVKELATKQNEVIASLKAAGVVAAA